MLVLASTSPRRAMLLEEGGFTFVTLKADVSEELPSEIKPEDGVKALALRKAVAGQKAWIEAGGSAEDIILGADTIVALDSQILGKPVDPREAQVMLQQLSGRHHDVYTGVALVNGTGCQENEALRTQVYFRPLTLEEIQTYIATGEPMDKAGAYAIQGGARKFVKQYEGSLSNVIGLPMEYVSERLRAWGIEQEDIALREVNDGLSPLKGPTRGCTSP
ncbi:Maf family protein [Desulfitobacterium metallireducens]|uniref:dTTP/UTP pyrophosphatase n=1 Tax=Desulfitobacterium metallireducens DSM 15288 TaxID=871968 RepID=W0EFF2_9FIRM|nr:Maf family protein [Desulfitobacterium metallireducens]AHF07929.1 septum formation inhibitor Maf [Desulfitobacterium metallireducens DSM 15288]